ncbi:MAG: UPF0261 family protein [Planctomycetota bacterium]|nr:MAG: UPF0261 family protein [Planctomycetota bacterium]
MSHALVVGTFDTKDRELRYVADRLVACGLRPLLVDLGTGGGARPEVDVTAEEVAAHHPDGAAAVLGLDDRGRAVTAMAAAFERFVLRRNGSCDDVGGMIGLGGSGGTALIAPGMRALPIGTPKVLVSTVASGDVAPYVGHADIAMMYSVTDVAGLNRISRRVLGNAAHALAGMMREGAGIETGADRPAIGLTMFGVTTKCVTRVTEALEADYDCLVFHATGTGGRSLEKLVDSGMLAGVIDVTTTEVCDLLMGGVMSAGEDRLGAIARSRLPWVGSCGALDMVNFGAKETVPQRYADRLLYVHNPQVTLMRTTVEENRRIGEWIARKLNLCEGPVRLLVPERGVSALDAEGQLFHDPEADAALFEALERTLRPTADRRLVRLPHHIDDPEFADALVASFTDITGGK